MTEFYSLGTRIEQLRQNVEIAKLELNDPEFDWRYDTLNGEGVVIASGSEFTVDGIDYNIHTRNGYVRLAFQFIDDYASCGCSETEIEEDSYCVGDYTGGSDAFTCTDGDAPFLNFSYTEDHLDRKIPGRREPADWDWDSDVYGVPRSDQRGRGAPTFPGSRIESRHRTSPHAPWVFTDDGDPGTEIYNWNNRPIRTYRSVGPVPSPLGGPWTISFDPVDRHSEGSERLPDVADVPEPIRYPPNECVQRFPQPEHIVFQQRDIERWRAREIESLPYTFTYADGRAPRTFDHLRRDHEYLRARAELDRYIEGYNQRYQPFDPGWYSPDESS